MWATFDGKTSDLKRLKIDSDVIYENNKMSSDELVDLCGIKTVNAIKDNVGVYVIDSHPDMTQAVYRPDGDVICTMFVTYEDGTNHSIFAQYNNSMTQLKVLKIGSEEVVIRK